jgi:hypothetical protein
LQGACIKSIDGGQTWIVPLFTDPKGGFFKAVVTHPRVHDIIYFAAGKRFIIQQTEAKQYFQFLCQMAPRYFQCSMIK